jgi:hypothetical protein
MDDGHIESAMDLFAGSGIVCRVVWLWKRLRLGPAPLSTLLIRWLPRPARPSRSLRAQPPAWRITAHRASGTGRSESRRRSVPSCPLRAATAVRGRGWALASSLPIDAMSEERHPRGMICVATLAQALGRPGSDQLPNSIARSQELSPSGLNSRAPTTARSNIRNARDAEGIFHTRLLPGRS